MGLFSRVTDTAAEVQGHRKFGRDIRNVIASGDKEAADTFRTGDLAAALTSKGRDARGDEVVEYVDKVLKADGNADRTSWLRR